MSTPQFSSRDSQLKIFDGNPARWSSRSIVCGQFEIFSSFNWKNGNDWFRFPKARVERQLALGTSSAEWGNIGHGWLYGHPERERETQDIFSERNWDVCLDYSSIGVWFRCQKSSALDQSNEIKFQDLQLFRIRNQAVSHCNEFVFGLRPRSRRSVGYWRIWSIVWIATFRDKLAAEWDIPHGQEYWMEHMYLVPICDVSVCGRVPNSSNITGSFSKDSQRVLDRTVGNDLHRNLDGHRMSYIRPDPRE